MVSTVPGLFAFRRSRLSRSGPLDQPGGPERGVTLIELLIFLGILVLAGLVLGHIFGGGSGSGGGTSPVPGADQFTQNVTNFENIMAQLGSRRPDAQVCEVLRTYYNAAAQGLANMQNSGAAGSNVLRVAQERLDKLKKYLDSNCTG